tara:strand:- start:21142 stop:21579 length:438 start_codon:yes stop_codon:yes gene_type:complete
MAARKSLSIILFSGDYDRVHYSLAMASAAAATDRPVTVFVTAGGLHLLLDKNSNDNAGWTFLKANLDGKSALEQDAEFSADGIAGIDELLAACAELDVAFYRCDMGVKAAKLNEAMFRTDIQIKVGGLVSFLSQAERDDGQIVFI